LNGPFKRIWEVTEPCSVLFCADIYALFSGLKFYWGLVYGMGTERDSVPEGVDIVRSTSPAVPLTRYSMIYFGAGADDDLVGPPLNNWIIKPTGKTAQPMVKVLVFRSDGVKADLISKCNFSALKSTTMRT
jgi:hypothetical protein